MGKNPQLLRPRGTRHARKLRPAILSLSSRFLNCSQKQENGDQSSDDSNQITPSPISGNNLGDFGTQQDYKQDYSLPRTPSFETLLQLRRQHGAGSVSASSRDSSPVAPSRGKRKRTRTSKTRSSVLLPGESDSSLTDQSADDHGDGETPHSGGATGTDEADGTEVGQEEDDVDEGTPEAGTSSLFVVLLTCLTHCSPTAATQTISPEEGRSVCHCENSICNHIEI